MNLGLFLLLLVDIDHSGLDSQTLWYKQFKLFLCFSISILPFVI